MIYYTEYYPYPANFASTLVQYSTVPYDSGLVGQESALTRALPLPPWAWEDIYSVLVSRSQRSLVPSCAQTCPGLPKTSSSSISGLVAFLWSWLLPPVLSVLSLSAQPFPRLLVLADCRGDFPSPASPLFARPSRLFFSSGFLPGVSFFTPRPCIAIPIPAFRGIVAGLHRLMW